MDRVSYGGCIRSGADPDYFEADPDPALLDRKLFITWHAIEKVLNSSMIFI